MTLFEFLDVVFLDPEKAADIPDAFDPDNAEDEALEFLDELNEPCWEPEAFELPRLLFLEVV